MKYVLVFSDLLISTDPYSVAKFGYYDPENIDFTYANYTNKVGTYSLTLIKQIIDHHSKKYESNKNNYIIKILK